MIPTAELCDFSNRDTSPSPTPLEYTIHIKNLTPEHLSLIERVTATQETIAIDWLFEQDSTSDELDVSRVRVIKEEESNQPFLAFDVTLFNHSEKITVSLLGDPEAGKPFSKTVHAGPMEQETSYPKPIIIECNAALESGPKEEEKESTSILPPRKSSSPIRIPTPQSISPGARHLLCEEEEEGSKKLPKFQVGRPPGVPKLNLSGEHFLI